MAAPMHDEGNDVHPFAVQPGEIVGYEVYENPVTRQCVHLQKRGIVSPMLGFWKGRQQVFHVMRPFAIQTTFDRERWWSRFTRRYSSWRIIIPPYPYVWRSYCGLAVFLDWEWRVATADTLHWAVDVPWFCRKCRAEKI